MYAELVFLPPHILTVMNPLQRGFQARIGFAVHLGAPGSLPTTLPQFFEPACYNVVVEAKLADLLVNHPNGLHVSELSKKTGIEAGKLARIMRFLATRHVFREGALVSCITKIYSKGSLRAVNEDVFANNRLSMMLVSSHGLHDLMGHLFVFLFMLLF